jgi:hypothetical protein
MSFSLIYRKFIAMELGAALELFRRLRLQTPQVFGVAVELLLHLLELFAIWKVIKPLLKAMHHILKARLIISLGSISCELLIEQPLGVISVCRILSGLSDPSEFLDGFFERRLICAQKRATD